MNAADKARQLAQWYQGDLGQAVQQAWRDELARLGLSIFGYHAAQLGCSEQSFWLDAISSRNKYRIATHATEQADLICDYTQLPWQSKSIDCLILPHTLSLVDDIATVLAEVDRVLVSSGWLIIADFNPFSLWGVPGLLPGWRKQAPWSLKFPTLSHVNVELANVGLQVDEIHHSFYRPPCANAKLLHNLLVLETIGRIAWVYPGACYVLVAQKTESTITQIKPLFRFRDFVVGKHFAQTDCRHQSEK